MIQANIDITSEHSVSKKHKNKLGEDGHSESRSTVNQRLFYIILTAGIRRDVITFCIWGLPILEILKEDKNISTCNIAR